MAGLYIHIPFCKKACHYCNFYFITSKSSIEKFIRALNLEIHNASKHFKFPIETIYFGGGTPSILSIKNLSSIISTIKSHYAILPNCEFSIEVNPDDIHQEYLTGLNELGFHRISIGIQSFFDDDLKAMNRSHDKLQGLNALNLLSQNNFKINADLIYGMPHSTTNQLKENIKIIHDAGISHLSCYSLTVEEKTKLHRLIQNKEIQLPKELNNIAQYSTLIETTEFYGFEQYEISNFAKNKEYSKHNMGYWFGKYYYGLGPSAHSYFDGKRSWNISNLNAYIEGIESKKIIQEEELLTKENIVNEYIITRLRTKWGINLSELIEIMPYNKTDIIKELEANKMITFIENNNIVLTQKGKIIADQIILQLMV